MAAKKRTKAKKPAPAPVPLKERHRVFVESYMGNGGNGVAAARAAGFSGTPAVLASRASELLGREDVKAALKERVENDPRVADRDELLRFFTRVMRGQNERGGHVKMGIKEKLEAAKLQGRAIGAFIHRVEVELKGQVVVTLPDNGRGDGPPPTAPGDDDDA